MIRRWAESHPGCAILLLGSPAEKDRIAAITAGLPGRVLNLAGRLTLRQIHHHPGALPAVHRQRLRADAYRRRPGSPTGGHLRTHRARHAPPRWPNRYRLLHHGADCAPCRHRECPTDHRCMTAVSVDEVLAAAEELWEPSLRGEMNKAVFLDRDGTLIQDRGYICDFSQVGFFPFAAAAVRAMNQAGYLVIVVSNQSAVARGICSEEQVIDLHRNCKTISKKRAPPSPPFITARSWPTARWPPTAGTAPCANRPRACCCRPPVTSTWTWAAASWSATRPTTSRPGKRAGCRTMLVRTGQGREQRSRLGHGRARAPITSSTTSWPPPAIIAALLRRGAGTGLNRAARKAAGRLFNGNMDEQTTDR